MASSTALVIVIYNPTENQKQQLLCISDSFEGVIVDNSDIPSFEGMYVGKMHYVANHENKGIAYAHNCGYKIIFTLPHIKHIVTFDQDSRITTDLVNALVENYEDIEKAFPNLFALGPTTINESNNATYSSIIHKDKEPVRGFIRRREINSSGCCISVEKLKEVGLEDERLFIDFVDCELCWRAYSKGYVSGITNKVTMNHRVGVKDIFIGKYQIIISSPFRYYYQYRNHLWLLRRSYVPTFWKFSQLIKHLCRLIYFPVALKDGWSCEKHMLKGIRDGLRRCK
ncbi:MAG: glycosyltransferase [Bacteroidaceae bacterium]|nr:glycosyltransferase [Bacteroidaceae bacterium]